MRPSTYSSKRLPDVGLLRQSFKVFPRRRSIRELEAAVLDNPSAGNYEELADLYMEDGNFSKARACYDKAISSRTDSPDPFYRRGVCEMELGDFVPAVPDLERVVGKDQGYDFHRAKGLLAHAYANTGQAGEGRGALPAGDDDFHVIGDLLQLRLLSCGTRKGRRSPRMGAEDSRQETDHARISAASRTSLVPQGGRTVEEVSSLNGHAPPSARLDSPWLV